MQRKISCKSFVQLVLVCVFVSFLFRFSERAFAENVSIDSYDNQDPIGSIDQEHKGQFPDADRQYELEYRLDTILYSNGDGTETAYIFDEPVKDVNEQGVITDKSNRLYSVRDYRSDRSQYAFFSKDNDIQSYFPYELSSEYGVFIEAQGVFFEMYPSTTGKTAISVENGIAEYDGVFNDYTALRYVPTFSGCKEDLVLYRYAEEEYSFIVRTDGLIPISDVNGSVNFVNSNSEICAVFNPLYVYDSNEEGHSLTLNNHYDIEYVSDNTYSITLVIDQDFLSDPNTVYPVIIDPTVTINATGSGSNKSILDTPIYNGSAVAGISSGGNMAAVLGRVDSTYGAGRLLMRFPGLADQPFWNNYYMVTSATLTLRDDSGTTSSAQIGAYYYTAESWDESSVYSLSKWNGVGSLLSAQSYSYPNNITKSFDITSAVNTWKYDTTSFNKGIILKNNTSESNTAYQKAIYNSEGSVKPYLTVTYQTIRPIADGIYYIKNLNSGKYIQAKNNGTSNGTEIVQYSYHGDKYQMIKVTYESDGYYSFRPMNVPNQPSCIDMTTNALANTDGTDCRLYTYDSSLNRQKFMIRVAAGGGFQIGTKSSNGNKVLEVTGSSTADNAVIQIWTYSDSRTNDNWQFEKAFGCAWGFNEKNNGYATIQPDYYINCYLYALGITQKPAQQTDGLVIAYGDSLETMRLRVEANLQERHRGYREISGPTAHISDNEYRICMRVGSHIIGGLEIGDYHFWLQTNTGEWCDKAGWYNAATFKGDVNPSVESWNAGFYDSNTLYFAITE